MIFDLYPLCSHTFPEQRQPVACLQNKGPDKHLNSLQVAQSERYVFSGIDDFEVVQKMLAMDEQYKYGPSVKIG